MSPVIDPKTGQTIDNTPKCPFVAVPVGDGKGNIAGFMGTRAFCQACIFNDPELKDCKLVLLCNAVLKPKTELKTE